MLFLLPAPYMAIVVFLACSLQGSVNEEEFLQILTREYLSDDQPVLSLSMDPEGR